MPNGPGDACPQRPNGRRLRAGPTDECIPGATPSTQLIFVIRQARREAAPVRRVAIQRELARTAVLTCREMLGNGVRIGLMRITIAMLQNAIREAPPKGFFTFCAVVLGLGLRRTLRAPHIAMLS